MHAGKMCCHHDIACLYLGSSFPWMAYDHRFIYAAQQVRPLRPPVAVSTYRRKHGQSQGVSAAGADRQTCLLERYCRPSVAAAPVRSPGSLDTWVVTRLLTDVFFLSNRRSECMAAPFVEEPLFLGRHASNTRRPRTAAEIERLLCPKPTVTRCESGHSPFGRKSVRSLTTDVGRWNLRLFSAIILNYLFWII